MPEFTDIDALQRVLLPTTREEIRITGADGFRLDLQYGGDTYTDVIDATSQVGTNPLGHRYGPLVDRVKQLYEEAGDIPLMIDGQGYYHRVQGELAATFTEIFPGDLDRGDLKVYYCNSGSEAMERGCLKAASLHRGGTRYVAMNGAFHGRTALALAHTSSKGAYRDGLKYTDQVATVPFATGSGGELHDDPDENVRRCLDILEERIRREGPGDINAITIEPLQGEGGYNVPHPDFLPGVREIASEYDIPLVDDEVQASIRTGEWFGIEQFDVQPDLIGVAKAFSGGIAPFGAALIRDEYATESSNKHSGTFGGNAKECFIALQTIDLIREHDFLDNAREQGQYLQQRFAELEDLDIVAEERGRGLFRGIEFRQDGEPAPELRDEILHRLLTEHNVLTESCGNDAYNTAIRFLLPVNLDQETAMELADAVEAVVRDVS